MEGAYYFSNGRLIFNKLQNNNDDIEMGIAKDNANDNANDKKDNRDKWYSFSMFRPRKFQIFSASILRYR